MTAGKSARYVKYLALYGSVSTGLIYLGIGIIAILSLLRLKKGGADESSLLVFLNDYFVGRIIIWVILLGTLSYIVWRIYEAIADPYQYGKNLKGKAKRLGIALSTIADVVIAYAAVRVISGGSNVSIDGQPYEERQMVADMLGHPWGQWIVILIGLVIFVTAVIQFVYGVTRGYRERLKIDHLHSGMKKLIHALAWAGYTARGVILTIISFFFIKAGFTINANHVVNTDKAFDFIGDHIGHGAFVAVATGTICYGLFMFVLGSAYDAEKG